MNGSTSLISFFSQVKPSKRRWLKENYAQTELIADIVTVLSSLFFFFNMPLCTDKVSSFVKGGDHH